MSPAPELKATLTLPQTAFPMKANLPQNEPLRLERWATLGLYDRLREAGRGRPAYMLHDGPPYANGPIHLGHALNKGLKDFVVKSKTMAGFDAPYVPGYDCHGLPIEIKVDEQLGRKKLEMPAPAMLDACRAYAQKYVDLQTSQFERIGCFGRWSKPYKTMARDYEARTLEAFYGFLEKGFVYRGLKPVYWCIHDRTALADAEIEYEQHTSPAIYVRYSMLDDHSTDDEQLNRLLANYRVWTIIWTTTPWTIPASMAVAFHPDFEYVALKQGADVYIVAAELAESVKSACKLTDAVEIERFKGAKLERTHFQHPFLEREILGVLATYVTADTGTGAVHTAPSHGADDFYTGQRYDLDPTCRVDASGRLHIDPDAWDDQIKGPAPFEGKKVWAANPIILEMLTANGSLMAKADLQHSYPHCWRCHNPVIFRATEQWFISLDTQVKRADGSETTYRQLTIEEIDKVVWDPAWGKERITNMIATRPDWCISRQRIWGVPIAVFLCEQCNQPMVDAELNKKIVALFDNEGVEAWHTTPAETLLGSAPMQCVHCGGTAFRKEFDILDVWFDSGASWFAVCESDSDLKDIYASFQNGTTCQGTTSVVPNDAEKSTGASAPAPQSQPTKVLYLEGGDQHRGWFHSSLLTSVALRGCAPYSHVVTAGWTLDEQGRAMSKSLGNGVDPVDIAKRMGGEIVRLWVASVDFREDMAASENLMQRCADLYRKLRNTFKILLGNLHGFNPANDAVPEAELLPLDRYMLARTRELTEKVLGFYDTFEFHRVYHAVNEFAIVDLSAFYIDVLKDRMYTFAPTNPARRSAQTVLWKITEALVRLVAPIMSFTADEVWEHLPHVEGRAPSVHLALFPKPEEIFAENPAYLINEWSVLFGLRNAVLRAIEDFRQKGSIGKSLDVDLHFYADDVMYEMLRKNGWNLPEFLKESFNVSKAYVHKAHGSLLNNLEQLANPPQGTEFLTNISGLRGFVAPASGHKCARCWNFMPEVSDYGIWHDVCTRCQSALKQMGIEPPQEVA